ncbi:RidA family protein [Rhodanobacter sp. MP1X3]|jgi:enamine deaminase RidA (YjgF/YER057c/UK114 family)|uniref:RidA family protein n=1 Tax=Rhodanobacter sp. MP1X3 TaxID=2723086 RepID=UPI00160779D0|nr:RidA family protein [Rhodanobacter sp. MP1X3]MBB6244707.1 enamine deaminase RidA (YjgF/YER057c/UK114 family) [Rhodanobacter sp. MP1X3]
MPRLARTLLPMLLMTLPMIASASDVTRYKLPNSTFPISAAVEVPAGKTMVYLSGQMGQMPKDANALKGAPVSMGDTRTQTISALTNIKKQLEGMHLSMGDVVKMQVFLVADKSKGDKLDFAGFMDGYTQFFGTKEQPNLPSRSAVQVAALVVPAALVEIEVTAVRP